MKLKTIERINEKGNKVVFATIYLLVLISVMGVSMRNQILYQDLKTTLVLVFLFSLLMTCVLYFIAKKILDQIVIIDDKFVKNLEKNLGKIKTSKSVKISIKLHKYTEEESYELGILLNGVENISHIDYYGTDYTGSKNLSLCEKDETFICSVPENNVNARKILWVGIADIFGEDMKSFLDGKNYVLYESNPNERFGISNKLIDDLRQKMSNYKIIHIVTSVRVPTNIVLSGFLDKMCNEKTQVIKMYNYDKLKNEYTERKIYVPKYN